MRITPRTTLLAAMLLAPAGLAQNLLTNPGFETGDFTGWNNFAPLSVFVEGANPPDVDPFDGNFSGKLFGDFVPGVTATGMFQAFPATPGDQFVMDCWSRQFGGDTMIGVGAPNDNWVVMKMAFFDAGGAEVGAAERTIMDGTFPANTWIDNAPVTGTAPAGTATVQAFILFIQPNFDPGACQVDEITFAPVSAGTYPGTGEDLWLSTALNGDTLTYGPTNDVKLVNPGDFIEVNVSSPSQNSDFGLFSFIIFSQLFSTGFPPVPFFVFPELYFDFTQPIILLQGGVSSPIGSPVINPNGGTSLYFECPPGLGGMSLMMQALVVDPVTANAFYAATDGHELRFQ